MAKSDLLVGVLAVDRLVRLVVDDEISRPLRNWVDGKWPDSKVSYLVHCKACVSVYAGLLVSSGLAPRKVIWALALSGAVLAADRQDERIGALVGAYQRKARASVSVQSDAK